jgi:hypothetical protein
MMLNVYPRGVSVKRILVLNSCENWGNNDEPCGPFAKQDPIRCF